MGYVLIFGEAVTGLRSQGKNLFHGQDCCVCPMHMGPGFFSHCSQVNVPGTAGNVPYR